MNTPTLTRVIIPQSPWRPLARLLGALFLALWLGAPAWATVLPPTGRPLAEALNPDGTLRAGATGSFDARQFRMRTAPDGRPVFRPTGTAGAGDERWQDGFGLSNGADTEVYAVVRSGADLYIGGNFSSINALAASRVAKWNGATWSALGTGVNGEVFALAVTGNGDVYAGGFFYEAGNIAANNVARWNGTAWSALGAGMVGPVYALAVAGNGDVYAGGNFSSAAGTTMQASRIAKWNGTAWSPVGTGNFTNGSGRVYALAVAANGDVYAGGNFVSIGATVAAYGVAKWDGTTWSTLGTALQSPTSNQWLARTLAIASNGDLYAGGEFNQAGSVAASNVARWNGTGWSALGAGVNGPVYALAVASNGDVCAGGQFTQAGGVAANGVARWNGTAWSALGTGAATGFRENVNALAVTGNGDVCIGGVFTQAGGLAVNNLAKWNGTAWGTIGTGAHVANGVSDSVLALAVASNGDVYAGGDFTQVGGLTANRVARWNGASWSSLGTGPSNGLNGSVLALAVAANGDVYAGGVFTQAGGVAANNVAKWNGTSWSNLGTGLQTPLSPIFAKTRVLAVDGNGDLYAGGYFLTAGSTAVNSVAKWNGTSWGTLGAGTTNGVGGEILAMAVAGNGDVYVAGGFATAGGINANNVAKWNGTAWSALGTGVNRLVSTMAVGNNGNVYVGGHFGMAGGLNVNYVAKWNGSAWSALGSGIGNTGLANAMAVSGNGDLYVGGSFPAAAGITVNHVAKWNGTAWSPLGTGLNRRVIALSIGSNGKLYAGGLFTATGDGSKVMARFAVYDPSIPLATTTSARATPAALFPNPAQGEATLRLPPGAPRRPLTLTDARGRLVRCYPAPAGPDAPLDLRGLPNGLYLVRCGQFTQRLVVE